MECCLCLQTKKPIMSTTADGSGTRLNSVQKLNEIDISTYKLKKLPVRSVFLANCGHHAICMKCLRDIAISKTEINRRHPLIRCLSPFPLPKDISRGTSEYLDTACVNNFGIPYYFSHADIFKVLTKSQFKEYLESAFEHEIPGLKMIRCPVNYFNPETKRIQECNSGVILDYNDIESASRGELIIQCNQNVYCQKTFCYHCRNRVINSSTCQRCKQLEENKDPYAFNHYVYNPSTASRMFLTNGEITAETVIQQMKEKLCQDYLRVRCFICKTYVIKSDQCNGITHCKTEICYSCGRSNFPEMRLKEHWSDFGNDGCPRWDNSSYWNEIAGCNFACEENICYSDEIGDCQEVDHRPGIQAMNKIRKKAHIYKMLKSLLRETRSQVYNLLETDPELEKYKEFFPSQEVIEKIDTTEKNSRYLPTIQNA